MTYFYYGGGNCSIEGNVSSLAISYRGAIVIDSKLPDGYEIKLEDKKLIIESDERPKNLNELFTYLGYFEVIAVNAYNLEGDKEYVTIKRVMDYVELLDGKVEDLTVKYEDLKVTYKVGRTFRKTRVKKLKGGR